MDIILDADTFHHFMDSDDAELKLILRKWLSDQNGKIAYSPMDKLEPGRKKGCPVRRVTEDSWMRAQVRAGKVRLATPQEVQKAEREAWEATCELENSPEIVASLARAEAELKAGRLKSWSDVKRGV